MEKVSVKKKKIKIYYIQEKEEEAKAGYICRKKEKISRQRRGLQ